MARQRVCRTALAHIEVRGGLSQRLRKRGGGALGDRVVICSFTTADALTPRLTGAPPIKLTTLRCPSAW